MTDICERLVRFAGKVCLSTDTEVEAAATIEALRAENARLQAKSEFIYDALLEAKGEIVRLREALKPFAEVGECESASFSYHFIRAARSAMGESDE